MRLIIIQLMTLLAITNTAAIELSARNEEQPRDATQETSPITEHNPFNNRRDDNLDMVLVPPSLQIIRPRAGGGGSSSSSSTSSSFSSPSGVRQRLLGPWRLHGSLSLGAFAQATHPALRLHTCDLPMPQPRLSPLAT